MGNPLMGYCVNAFSQYVPASRVDNNPVGFKAVNAPIPPNTTSPPPHHHHHHHHHAPTHPPPPPPEI